MVDVDFLKLARRNLENATIAYYRELNKHTSRQLREDSVVWAVRAALEEVK